MKKRVLILCTGNSCRSIMAEALINYHLGETWEACSAGVEPSRVNPRAIRVLNELGIDTANFRSKSVDEFLNRDDIDLVITVCDHAKQTCPTFPSPIPRQHIAFEDPSACNNEPDEIALPVFRRVRDEIDQRLVREFLANYNIG